MASVARVQIARKTAFSMNIFIWIHSFVTSSSTTLYYLENTELFVCGYENNLNKYRMKTISKDDFRSWFIVWKPFLEQIQSRWYDLVVTEMLKKRIITKKDISGLYL